MNYRLLIVDDEPKVLKAIERQLLDFDIDVITAENPREAMKIISNNVIDILITDQKMPGVSGLELVSFCQTESPSTVLILMSGYADHEIFIHAINNGHIFYFIKKPWEIKELVSALEKAISYKKQAEYKEHVIKSYLMDKTKWMAEISKYNELTAKNAENIISAFKKIIEVKDKELSIHSQRVAEIAEGFAVFLGLSAQQCADVRNGAEFHDLGKIVIKDRILYKESSLSTDEFEEMKRHPQVGAEVLREVGVLDHVALIVEQHHEKADGSGYPKGLLDYEICIEAKIISISDAFDALVSKRVYKDGMDSEAALSLIRDGKTGSYNKDFIAKFEEFIRNR